MTNQYDKHYTPAHLAKRLASIVLARYDPELFKYIEPAAGSGNWIDFLPKNTIAYDIEPDNNDPRIIRQDFLTSHIPKDSIIVGNPPFGYACSEAIKFFNHAAERQLAHAICFILPRSFSKHISVLNPYYHLRFTEPLAETQFGTVSVRCMFQIWERRDYPRSPAQNHRDIEHAVVKADSQTPTHYLQRIGTNIGIYSDIPVLNDGVIPIQVLNDVVLKTSFQKLIKTYAMRHTVSVLSISIPELNRLAQGKLMISKTILNKLANQDEYNFGLFLDDAKAREELNSIAIDDLDVFSTRLEQFKNDVAEYQAAEAARRAEELEAKRADLEKLLAGAGYNLSDLEAVFGAAQTKAQAKEPKAQKKQKSDKPTQRMFTVVLGGSEYQCNGKVLTKAIINSTKFQSFSQEQQQEYTNNVDAFMREHSKEYCDAYPFNASYKGNQFYYNKQGKMNRQATHYFDLFMVEHPNATVDDFKAAVLKG